jgi:hypothetical protein
MIRPMTPWQKVVAWSALVLVAAWTLWGLFAIWVILSEGRA